jgi:hypothetical protein
MSIPNNASRTATHDHPEDWLSQQTRREMDQFIFFAGPGCGAQKFHPNGSRWNVTSLLSDCGRKFLFSNVADFKGIRAE